MSNEERAFAYQSGDRAALLPLWTQVEKLARLMIRRYLGLARRNRAVDYEDLLQAAFLAAESAASAYREDTGGARLHDKTEHPTHAREDSHAFTKGGNQSLPPFHSRQQRALQGQKTMKKHEVLARVKEAPRGRS